jgi:replication factor C subunit 3/5
MEIHKSLSKQLKNVVKSGDFPHLLLYGPSGAGKKTRYNMLLPVPYSTNVSHLF